MGKIAKSDKTDPEMAKKVIFWRFFQFSRFLKLRHEIAHGFFIRRLDFSLHHFEVQPFHIFWSLQNPFTIAAEIKKLKI